ncbi:MAG: TonB-dependent receptor [Paludibacteraceae bacterium]|nr:TonB-dependent receptor [Paludibacteraceae bacterium]
MNTKSIPITLILLFACVFPFWAQVSGVILDENGEPVIGASILEKGTTNGTITDFDGNFMLDVAEGATLEISYVGYATQSLPAAANMRIVLKEDTEVLEEVVVVGYGVQKKSDLTGAISQVTEKDLQKVPAPSIGVALEGRAAGLQVTGSGAPGSNVSLNIRGIGSINNSQPLIVIDGVPTDVPLNMINMDDVASVDVLKDASATAIYGSRGAYGVVIITTKKGDNEKGHINLKASFGFDQLQRTLSLLKAYQFASLHNEMMEAAGQPQYSGYADPLVFGDGTDWMSELWQFAPTQNYSLSYSGGTKKSNFYVSGAYYDQKGIIKTTAYKRLTLQFNHDTQLFDWLKFGHKLSLNHDIKSGGAYNIQNTMRALPTQPIYNEDGTWAGPVGLAMYVGDIANPIGKMMENTSTTKGYNILGNIYAEIKPVDWLIFKTTFGIQALFWDKEGWTPKYDWQPIAQPESEASREFDKSITWLWDNTLTFVKTFKQKHNFTAMIGSSMQANTYEFMSGSVQGFISETAKQLSNGLLEPTIYGNKSDWALLSFMGRVTYGYDNRYLLTATFRADGSSRFAKKNRWGYFPSVALAWRMSEEHWFEKNFWLSDLKLRAGYGQTGNQASVGNYAYASQLQTVQYVLGDKQVPGLAPWVLPNPNVRWETVEQYNVGADFAFFDQRLHATVDWYIKNTNDMLVPMSVPISSGYSDEAVPSINAGRMRNTGVEVSLNSLNFKKTNFTWTTTVNFAYNHNTILSLNDDVPMYFDCNIHKVGYPVAAFYGYVTDGIFQTQEEVDMHAVQTIGSDKYSSTQPGDIRFKDLNGDGIINEDDRTVLGSPTPTWTFSMNNRFEFYGVDVEVYLQGAAGNKIYNGNRSTLEAMSVAQNQMTTVLDRWRPDNPTNTMPRAVFSDPNKNNRVSDRFLESGDYLRLKSITIGYTLPKKYTKKALMDEVRFSFSGQNLYTLTRYTGLDPEVGGSGIDSNVYPLTRNFTFGLNITF